MTATVWLLLVVFVAAAAIDLGAYHATGDSPSGWLYRRRFGFGGAARSNAQTMHA